MTKKLLLLLSLPAVISVAGFAQDPQPPIERQNLIKALQIGGLTETELAEQIKLRHLAFEMTVTDEEAFRKAGAGNLLITTFWENDAFKVQPGPPLTRDQIVTLLANGTPSRRMERIVRERHVKMALEKAATDDIVKAGGSENLIGIIIKNLIEEKKQPDPPPVAAPPPPVVKAPTAAEIKAKYDSLMADAQKTSRAHDYLGAMRILDDAKKLDPKRPDAFRLAGSISLYNLGEVIRGGQEYREAIKNGGEVEFDVEHLHGRKLGLKEQYCSGKLFVSQQGAHYQADDRTHTFRFTKKEIVDMANDSTMKVVENGFHVKLDRGGAKSEALHFRAPRAKNRAEEEKLIMDLLR
jgi:hypothetical protein